MSQTLHDYYYFLCKLGMRRDCYDNYGNHVKFLSEVREWISAHE